MNLLCLDYGTKRIGVAVATTPLAQPIGIIANSEKRPVASVISTQAIDRIVELISEFGIEKILVGISEGEMAQRSRQFISELKKNTTLPVEEIDETLSSVEAGEHMKHMKSKKRRSDRDHFAAASMLQDYLDLSTI